MQYIHLINFYLGLLHDSHILRYTHEFILQFPFIIFNQFKQQKKEKSEKQKFAGNYKNI